MKLYDFDYDDQIERMENKMIPPGCNTVFGWLGWLVIIVVIAVVCIGACS